MVPCMGNRDTRQKGTGLTWEGEMVPLRTDLLQVRKEDAHCGNDMLGWEGPLTCSREASVKWVREVLTDKLPDMEAGPQSFTLSKM